MQRIVSLVKTLTTIVRTPPQNARSFVIGSVQQFASEKLLQTFVPVVNPICNFKVKGRVRRRCKACYMVVRDERLYVICPKFPRHKQMAMKPKPHNTWILTHASQSPVRPW